MSSATKKSDAKPDQESLMALHALLQIRSKSGSSNMEGQGEDQESEHKFAKPPRKRAKKAFQLSTQAPSDSTPPSASGPTLAHLQSLSSSVSFAQTACGRESLKNLQTMNGQPIHGFLNLAAAPSPMSSSAAQFSAAISALMQPSPIGLNQRFLSSQFRPESDAPMHFSNSVVQGLSSKEQFSQPGAASRFTGRELVASMEESSLKTKDPHGITPATSPSPTPDELIRREEVEAALKSKPQRGRKRENLNVMERLELTRTRNREHAKSTRIRKKQRYQELVDNERRLQALQSAEDLNLMRRQCVMKFVNIREQMLNNLRGGSGESNTDEVAHKPAPMRRGSVSFCNLQDSVEQSERAKEEEQSLKSDAASENGTEENRAVVLNDVIDNLANFSFNASPLGSRSWVRPEGVHALTGVTMMKRFDNSILSLLQQHLNDAAIPALSYTVQGSFEGIAVNAEGKGFARVDLELKGIEGRTAEALVSSILTLQFSADSDKLMAVEWSVVLDRLSPRSLDAERQGGQDNRSDSGESLASQTVYPSVVSLDHNMCSSGSDVDHAAPKDRSNDVDEGPGPGMNI